MTGNHVKQLRQTGVLPAISYAAGVGFPLPVDMISSALKKMDQYLDSEK